MTETYIEYKEFEGVNFSETPLSKGEYVHCTFERCVFTGADLSGFHFMESGFNNCDLSLTRVVATSFVDVTLCGCKLVGVHFEEVNTFGLSMFFEQCRLNLSTFYQVDLRSSRFKECGLEESDFTDANLSGLVLNACDFSGAVFKNTNLEKTDLRTSNNYSIRPDANRIRKAKFSVAGILGLLDGYDIEIG